jgi:flagellar hook-length control protein FliK
MQVTPTVASRPAASAQAHAADADPAAEGESFASLLAGPAEPAVVSPSATASRERQATKTDAARLPRSAAAGGAPRHSPSATQWPAEHRADGPVRAATDAPSATEPVAKHGEGDGNEDAGLSDWLASLIQWPGTADMPAPPALPGTAAPAPLPAGTAATDANATTTLDLSTAAGSKMTFEAQPTVLDPRHSAPPDRVDAEPTPSHAPTNPAPRGTLAQREASRSGDDALKLAHAADALAPQGGATAQVEAAAQAVVQQNASRSSPAPGTAAEPVPVPMASTAGVTDRTPVADTAPAAVPVPLPLDDPRFAQALGTQVSLLARDGVHEASLQLNPAEMGPVSVQIVLDGTQARVEFGAEMAHTREVIERSLPELAAALRDAGLTLTGGSVSQHQPDRGEPQTEAHRGQGRGSPDRADRTADAAHDPLPAPAQRWVRTGGLDLYA